MRRLLSLSLYLALCLVVSNAILFSGFVNAEISYPQNMTLKLVQILFRHGDRTPTSKLPTDNTVWKCRDHVMYYFKMPSHGQEMSRVFQKEYINNMEVLPGDCYAGEITPLGLQQHIELGRKLRQIYVNQTEFLSPTFNKSEIYIRSGDLPRCLESAEAQLTGLYPDIDNSEKPYIKIFTVDNDAEYISPSDTFCPKFDKTQQEAQNSTAWKKFMKTAGPFLDDLYQVLQVPKYFSIWEIFSSFMCLVAHDRDLPPGVDMAMVDELVDVVNQEFQIEFASDEAKKLGIGALLRDFMQRINNTVTGKDAATKYIMYSGHDFSIAPILTVFDTYQTWPPYASHMHFELFEDQNNEHFVRILYNDAELVVKGCNGQVFCKLSDFASFMSKYVLTDVAADCVVPYNQM